jgi:hypothetical protein
VYIGKKPDPVTIESARQTRDPHRHLLKNKVLCVRIRSQIAHGQTYANCGRTNNGRTEELASRDHIEILCHFTASAPGETRAVTAHRHSPAACADPDVERSYVRVARLKTPKFSPMPEPLP